MCYCPVLLIVGVLSRENCDVIQVEAFGNSFGQAGGEAMAAALTSKTALEQLTVGNIVVGSFVKLRSSGETCTVTCFNSDGSVDIKKSDGTSTTIDDVGRPGKEQFDPIPAVLPVKQLRENTITELKFNNSGLGVDGGIMLAALLATNTSVTVVDVSNNRLGAEGGKALAAGLKDNTTITQVR